jgi:hypothetical protein
MPMPIGIAIALAVKGRSIFGIATDAVSGRRDIAELSLLLLLLLLLSSGAAAARLAAP